ncbi:hypothetical protein J2T58_002049, partial [Methanocalculus alkaliphilus]|nr:hypothetical protein [Methanocalculus alkaliphilus]
MVVTGIIERGISFRWLLFGIIIVIILLITGFILNLNYHASKNTLEEHTRVLKENTEYSLIQSLILTDQGLRLFDQSLDYRLWGEMAIFLRAYEESNSNPAEIDLELLQEMFGEGYELYIINEKGIIEYTTYPPDHLLDFSLQPNFMKRLTSIRMGSRFVSDRVIPDIQTGQLRKYAYHPTPDHQYILEIGYINDDIEEMRSALLYQEAVETILENNPYLTSIRVFHYLGGEIENPSYIPEEEISRIIATVLETGEEYVIENPDTDTIIRYVFVDLTGNDNPPEMNLVAELTSFSINPPNNDHLRVENPTTNPNLQKKIGYNR